MELKSISIRNFGHINDYYQEFPDLTTIQDNQYKELSTILKIVLQQYVPKHGSLENKVYSTTQISAEFKHNNCEFTCIYKPKEYTSGKFYLDCEYKIGGFSTRGNLTLAFKQHFFSDEYCRDTCYNDFIDYSVLLKKYSERFDTVNEKLKDYIKNFKPVNIGAGVFFDIADNGVFTVNSKTFTEEQEQGFQMLCFIKCNEFFSSIQMAEEKTESAYTPILIPETKDRNVLSQLTKLQRQIFFI